MADVVNVKDHLAVNKLVELEIDIDKGTIEQKEVFSSRVEDMKSDSIVVAAPYKRGTLVPVPVGEEVLIRVGKHGSYLLFHTKVKERKGGQQPILKLSMPFKTSKIQMRSWVRVDSSLPVLYRVLGVEDDLIKSNTLDVSGGGFCMLVDAPIEKDTLLEVNIMFPDNFILRTTGIVCRCFDENKVLKLGVCFQEIDEKYQERIVNYVFKKQREYIQKGVAKN